MSERRMPEKDDLPSNSFARKSQMSKEKHERKQVVAVPKKRERNAIERGATEIKDYIVEDILIPQAKDTVWGIVEGIFDMFKSTVEAYIFGEAKPRWNSSHYKRGSGRARSHVPYSSIYDRGSSMRRRKLDYDEEDDVVESYRDLTFTREEVEDIREEMYAVYDDQGYLTVGDLNFICGIKVGNPQDETWGWESLSGLRIRSTRRGGRFTIDMPRPRAL